MQKNEDKLEIADKLAIENKTKINADIKIKISRLPHGRDLPLPKYQTDYAAGMDLLAAVESCGLLLKAGEFALIPTGIAIALPNSHEAQVRPRSGLAAKHGIGLVNSPGTIDSDYRGEIKVIAINWGKEDFLITRGMRIAQMIIAPVSKAALILVDELEESGRGDGGFGHTGV